MKLLKKKIIILVLILFIGAALRLYQLGGVPQSLNWDEVSLGYNAYSILMTGRDEYGDFLPLVMRSFDDYKPALYAYLVIPFVASLGLIEQSVRLPSAIAGIAAILIVYFLVCEILGSKKIRIYKHEVSSITVALVTAFFVAISPWHIQFSRVAFESNVGLTFNLLAFLLFMKGLKRPFFLLPAFIVAALNIHMYQSDRVFSPLLMIVLTGIYYRVLFFKYRKWLLFSVAAAFVVALPLGLYILRNDDALLRAKGVSVFSEQKLVENSSLKLIEDEKNNNILGKILDNRRVEYGKATVAGYISHFDPNWLFITGDIARHHAPFMGLLYIFQIPLILIGIYMMVFLKIDVKGKIAFFAYFLLVPIPASITSGVPHAVRTLNFVWTWELFAAVGLIGLVSFLVSQKNIFASVTLKAGFAFYLFIALINFLYYLNQYFVQLNYFNAADWLYGYKQAVAHINSVREDYDNVIVENTVPFDQSYMFFLFYLKVDPAYYQSLGGTKSGGFKEEHKGFYNLSFRPVNDIKMNGRILLMGKPGDFDSRTVNNKTISYPNGTPAIVIAEK